jgi:hypothetical protein
MFLIRSPSFVKTYNRALSPESFRVSRFSPIYSNPEVSSNWDGSLIVFNDI